MFHNQSIPRTHDLVFLLKLALKFNSSLEELFDDFTILNEYSISARYPSDFEDKRTVQEASEAYDCLLNIKKTLEGLIK